MKHIARKTGLLMVLAGVLAVVGCSRNDDDDDGGPQQPVVSTVPDSAGVSVAAFTSYITGLANNDDSNEPSTLKDSFAVPPDETSEPAPLS